MGLRELLEKKALENAKKQSENIEVETINLNEDDDNPRKMMYDRAWLEQVCRARGYAANSNNRTVDTILRKLRERDGFCPCGGNTKSMKCPCKMMREYNNCRCKLFVTDVKEREPKSNGSTARIRSEK